MTALIAPHGEIAKTTMNIMNIKRPSWTADTSLAIDSSLGKKKSNRSSFYLTQPQPRSFAFSNSLLCDANKFYKGHGARPVWYVVC